MHWSAPLPCHEPILCHGTHGSCTNPSRISPTPNHCRGQAIALATLTNFGSNFLVSLLLPSVQEQIGQGGELQWDEPDGC